MSDDCLQGPFKSYVRRNIWQQDSCWICKHGSIDEDRVVPTGYYCLYDGETVSFNMCCDKFKVDDIKKALMESKCE